MSSKKFLTFSGNLIVPLGCDTTRLWKYDISYRKHCFRRCLASVKIPWFGKTKDTKLVLKRTGFTGAQESVLRIGKKI